MTFTRFPDIQRDTVRMSSAIFILILLIAVTLPANSQVLKGRITSQAGDPVPYSTVYIRELRQGTTSNARGEYEIRIPSGSYTVIYQSLGYEPVSANIILSNKTVTRNVILPLQYYQIPEVRITASGEDPAYAIMRKAIALAPYYLSNIGFYKANVYLKGNLIIKKIPGLLKRSMKAEAKKGSGNSETRVEIKEGDIYMMESYNEIDFTAPDRYVQKVISYNSTFPEKGNEISPMEYISASFYQPVIADMAISPLSPNAFSHYRFRYLGATSQGDRTINKIQVIPKRKSQQLFEGYIYIIDDLWCIHSIDMTIENIAGKIRVRQLYLPVQDDIWMPVSDEFEINISIVGFKADAGYMVSVRYTDVRPNLALNRPNLIIPQKGTGTEVPGSAADTASTKTQKQVNRILAKEEMSNRDMLKLSRLMQKESENGIKDTTPGDLEIQDKTTHIIEPDAGKRDSAYWVEIRPIPLSEPEIRSIRKSDSIKKLVPAKEIQSDTLYTGSKNIGKEKGFISGLKHIGLGHTWSGKDGFSFRFGGLIEPGNLSFNTVDGFIYGINFRAVKSWENNRTLSVYPDIKWAFSRQQLMWRLNANYRFDGMKRSSLYLRAGMTSRDINSGGGINPLLNTFTSLFLGQNYMKLYGSDFLKFGFRTDITNGLEIELSAGFEKRNVLENTTSFKIINTSREYTENIPENRYLGPGSDPVHALRDQDHSAASVELSYTPRQKFRVNKGRKIPAGSSWPTFSLRWEHVINDFREGSYGTSHYDMIRAEASQSMEFGAFSEFRWTVRAGGFIDNSDLTFYDFFHFNTQPFPVLINDYRNAFMNPSYYSLSTPEPYAEVHVKYTTPYLLLKLLPVMSNTLLRENLSLSFLGSRFSPAYTELGYSLSEIFFFAETGVFAGFENLHFNNFGLKVIFKFD
jgi:hypothetical protein